MALFSFLKNTERILAVNYIPTEIDVLLAYAPTCGLSDYMVRSGHDRFRWVPKRKYHCLIKFTKKGGKLKILERTRFLSGFTCLMLQERDGRRY